ncbi:MAG: SMC-Scp complex subunit ScpB [Holdemania massiliensis]
MENQALTIVEGLLFIVGDEGLTLTQCAAVLDVSESEAQLILEDLQRLYADDQRGIEVVDYGGVFKFVSKAAIHPYAQKLFANAKNTALSQSALETLAIIAYKQPITRVEIEEIRGVGCDMMLRKLQARGLIKEADARGAGPADLFEVTEEFMDSLSWSVERAAGAAGLYGK